MRRWLVFVLPLTLGLVLPLSALADQEDLDWLDEDSEVEAEEEADEEEEEEADEEAGEEVDEFEATEEKEAEEEDEEEAAAIEVSTEEPDENAVYEMAGRLHAFLGVGYSLPVIDLTGDGVGINTVGAKGNVFGGLPIWFGADYFFIDHLATGIKLRITPLFASGGQDAKGTLFDLHVQAGYHFFPALRLYLGLGYSKLNAEIITNTDAGTIASEADAFSLGLGLSYTFYLTEAGPGGLGLEVGAEYVMMVSPDFKSNPRHGVKGTVADNLFMYPLVLVGLRYSLAI